MYLEVQKGLIVPFIALPCLGLFYALYKFGKKPILGASTFEDRMEPLYSFAAAALLGQFLFQALPNATGPSGPQIGVFVSLFVMIGFFIMLCVQKYQRVSHENPYYVSPENNSACIVSSLDPSSMELVEYFHASDLESEDVARQRFQLSDEHAELQKRRRIHVLTVIIMTVLCILEGFFFIYREASWKTYFFFIVHKFMETLIIGVSMLHALIHATAEREHRWYLYTSLVWTAICACSTVPMLVGVSYDVVYGIVNHLATNIFYALAGGFLFWIALYYIWIDRKQVDKRDTVIRLAIFGVTGAVSWIVGYYV